MLADHGWAMSRDQATAVIASNLRLEFSPQLPCTGSSHSQRFELYRQATTGREFIEKGGDAAALARDFSAGRLRIPAIHALLGQVGSRELLAGEVQDLERRTATPDCPPRYHYELGLRLEQQGRMYDAMAAFRHAVVTGGPRRHRAPNHTISGAGFLPPSLPPPGKAGHMGSKQGEQQHHTDLPDWIDVVQPWSLVWAKVRSYPWWPAYIPDSDVLTESQREIKGSGGKDQLLVFFLGAERKTHLALVGEEEWVPFGDKTLAQLLPSVPKKHVKRLKTSHHIAQAVLGRNTVAHTPAPAQASTPGPAASASMNGPSVMQSSQSSGSAQASATPQAPPETGCNAEPGRMQATHDPRGPEPRSSLSEIQRQRKLQVIASRCDNSKAAAAHQQEEDQREHGQWQEASKFCSEPEPATKRARLE